MSKSIKILVALVALGAALAGGWFWLDGYAQKAGEERVAAFFEQVKDVARAEYGEVDVDLLGLTAGIKDMKLSLMGGQHFTVREFILRDYAEVAGMPSAMNVSVHGVEVPVTPENFEEMHETFRSLGHLSVTLDFDMDYSFDQDKDTFELDNLSLTLRDLGALAMNLELGNVNIRDLVASQGATGVIMTLRSAEVKYVDHSLFEQMIEGAAREEGKTVNELMAEMEAVLAGEIALAVAENDQFAVDGLNEIREFLRNPGTLAITIKPERPVGMLTLLELENAADVITRLNIRFEAKKN